MKMRKLFQTSKARPKHELRGFTLVELLVVIAVIALLMAILLPALQKAREHGKRSLCLAHIKQLQMAWNLYTEDNNGKVPQSDVWFSWNGNAASNPCYGPAWYEYPHVWPHAQVTPGAAGAQAIMQNYAGLPTPYPWRKEDWQHSIAEGKLWKYINDYRVYGCPVAKRGVLVTYTVIQSMGGYPVPDIGAASLIVRNTNQVKRTSERIVFVDEPGGENAGAGRGNFLVDYDSATWWDAPPENHGKGTTFSFMDGHSEYKKWTTGALTYPGFGLSSTINPPWCDCDLRWLMKYTWGKVRQPCPGNVCEE